ncbi:hypothetical protein Tco_1041459 [Tanacetum coccineum]|uniref:Uncharacterized protein n=1 Tax=Tanacetum coccineum TaxID=301880 RepID=A0ABQ5GHV6_9ASTR
MLSPPEKFSGGFSDRNIKRFSSLDLPDPHHYAPPLATTVVTSIPPLSSTPSPSSSPHSRHHHLHIYLYSTVVPPPATPLKGQEVFVSGLNRTKGALGSTAAHKGAFDMALPTRDQRHQYLRYEGLQYTDANIVDFDLRLTRIYRREVHRVHVFDFGGLSDLMADGLSARMLMEHRHAQGVSLFTSRFEEAIVDLDMPGALQFQLGGARRRLRWRQFIIALGLHTREKMESPRITSARDFLSTAPSYTIIQDPILRLYHRLIACCIAGRSQAPEKVTVTDLFYLRGMGVGSVNVPYLLARYLRLFAAGRKSGAHISGGQFVARLAKHFGLLTAEILQGLTVIAPELLIIDMVELVRLQICMEIDDTWAWAALGLERQPDAAAGALRPLRMLLLLMRVSRLIRHSYRHLSSHHHHIQLLLGLCPRDWGDLRRRTFPGSSPAAFHRRTKQRTGEASTSTAHQDQQQPDL